MPSVQVTLGDITFEGFEVPERLPFGVGQSLVVHKLVGGARSVDSMGRDDPPIEWSGTFMGVTALDRALYLKNQVVLGQAQLLTWGQLRYLVKIEQFEPQYEFPTRIPYRISCIVVEDQGGSVKTLAPYSLDDQMSQDMDTANGLGALVGDGVLSSALSVLSAAISGVSSFANASQSTINSVLGPLGAVQTQTTTLLAASINTTQNIASVGGLVPSSPLLQQVQALANQSNAFTSQPALLSLQGVIGRMNANLGSAAGNSTTRTVAGGNLMSIAADQYGDAMAWTGIAKANGLTDPVVSGVSTLIVPNVADSTGGLLGA